MLTLLLVLQGAPQRPAQLTRFLQQSIELDAGQLEAVERGEPIVKVLETRDRRDVAIFGIITTPTSREQHTRAMRDFPTSLRTPTRTQLGVFSNPATEADVAAVTINSRDVAEMKNCKPGDCVAKLPATDMRRIHEQMNWSAPSARAKRSPPSSPNRHTSTRRCRHCKPISRAILAERFRQAQRKSSSGRRTCSPACGRS